MVDALHGMHSYQKDRREHSLGQVADAPLARRRSPLFLKTGVRQDNPCYSKCQPLTLRKSRTMP
jgi:hypothetical protein